MELWIKQILCFIGLLSCIFASPQNKEEVLLDMAASGEKLSWLTWPDWNGWQITQQAVNGSLLYNYFSCNVGKEQDNWLRTTFILRPLTVTQVFVEMKFVVRDCSSFGADSLSCKETFNLYTSEADTDIGTSFRKGQFHKVATIAPDEISVVGDMRMNTETLMVDSLSKKGFYLAFQNTGSCMAIYSIRVYYTSYPAMVTSLTTLPETVSAGENQELQEVTGAPSAEKVLLDMVASGGELGWLSWPDEDGWQTAQQAVNGSLLYNYFSCNVGKEQDNWLRTTFILRPLTVTQVFVEMKFVVRDCSSFSADSLSCKETFNLYTSEADTDIGTSFRKGQFHKVATIAPDEISGVGDMRMNTETLMVDSLSKKGFYLAFQNTGSCMAIYSIRVYYTSYPAMVTSSTTLPETVSAGENQELQEVTGAPSAEKVLLDMVASGGELGWLSWPDEDGWQIAQQAVNGSLLYNYFSCNVGKEQDNWLRTTFILRPLTVTQVFVEMKFVVRDCSSFSADSLSCKETFNLYTSEADTDIGTSFRKGQFRKVATIAPDEISRVRDMRMNTETLMVDSLSKKGFYLAFQNTGSCMGIYSIRVYYTSYPAMVTSSTTLPETVSAGEKQELQEVTGAPSAESEGQVHTFCIVDGEWIAPVNEN